MRNHLSESLRFLNGIGIIAKHDDVSIGGELCVGASLLLVTRFLAEAISIQIQTRIGNPRGPIPSLAREVSR